MDHEFCPGSKLLRQPAPEMFTCPSCGEEVEIWTDELKGACPGCGRTVYRDATMSCLDWCKYGRECVGDTVYENYMRNRAVGLKGRLLEGVRRHFGEDRKRIRHAERVLRWAEKLLEEETADWHIVIPAAVLHDVGIKAAESTCGSSAAAYQEKEGPPVAREMLLRLGFSLEDIEQVCDIIGHHHHPREPESLNFRVLWDADQLTALEEEHEQEEPQDRQRQDKGQPTGRIFFTETGKKFAREQGLSRSGSRTGGWTGER